ncbi:UNVERIFIED_CONTAM: hypothetical protein FKN15_005498 [Acipenser sinensis]
MAGFVQSEDLMSDVEPLPASLPPTPSASLRPKGRDAALESRRQNLTQSWPSSPYSSSASCVEVTARLYSSLQKCREAEAQADRSETCARTRPSLASSNRASSFASLAAAPGGSLAPVSLALQQQEEEGGDDDSFESDSTASLLNARPLQEESSPPLSVSGLEGLFPRYSRLHADRTGLPSSSGQILRDSVEKERTRRRHCEKQIQNLHNKTLELQQQLALAVSADRKKDIMIEQLDKVGSADPTLAKVVEGWKKHEAEKNDAVKRLQEEKEAAERAQAEQQKVLVQFEESLAQAVEAMALEQKQAGHLQKEKLLLGEELAGLQRQVEEQRQRGRALQAELEEAGRARLLAERQGEAVRDTLGEQRDAWARRERELEERLAQQEADFSRQLQTEKERRERESQRVQDSHQVLLSVQAEVQRLETELETAQRDRDTLSMEMSLAEGEELAGLQRQVEEQRQRGRALQAELEEAGRARLLAERQGEAVRDTLGEQRDAWARRERELEERLAQQEADFSRQLQTEKVGSSWGTRRGYYHKHQGRDGSSHCVAVSPDSRFYYELDSPRCVQERRERESQRVQDSHQVLLSVQAEVQRLETELETAQRDRDTLRMEMSLAEARFETHRLKMESELKISLEQQVTERLAPLHQEHAEQASALREQHSTPSFLPPPQSDLSSFFHSSFLSSQSFSPLEPQLDETALTALGFHRDELAEHPLAEERGEGSGQRGHSLGTSLDSSSSSSKHSELQHYIHMLLDRSPGDPLESRPLDSEEPPNSHSASQYPQYTQHPRQGGSPVLRARSTGLRDHVRPAPTGQSAVLKICTVPEKPSQRSTEQNQPPPSTAERGVLTPKQIGELSRLLGQYQGHPGKGVPSMEELYTYLRGVEPNR